MNKERVDPLTLFRNFFSVVHTYIRAIRNHGPGLTFARYPDTTRARARLDLFDCDCLLLT